MPRFEQYGRLDSAPLTDGDPGFQGVNMLDLPETLAPGEVAQAENCRFTNNEKAERGGYVKLPWTNRVSASSLTPLPFGTIHGAGEFRDPNGLEWGIVAADGGVFRLQQNGGAAPIALPPGVVIDAAVTFTQTFSGLVMFRGPELEELIMVDLDQGFAPVSFVNNLVVGAGTENPADGTRAISPAANGDWLGNRLFIPVGDYIEVSDYLNPTRYASVRAQARINQGTSDQLVRFFPFNENTGIAFKSGSIHVIDGILGDLADMSQKELTREYGCCAPQSCINTGADVWFLAERRGICSIRLTEQNMVQGVDLPVSAKIQPLIDRIDWAHASACRAVWHENKAYFAVPLDDGIGLGPAIIASGGTYYLRPGTTYRWTKASASDTATIAGVDVNEAGDYTTSSDPTGSGLSLATLTGGTLRQVYSGVNNAVLVYDFLKQKWAGHDLGAGLMVQSWLKLTYAGARRLFFLSADGFINLYEEGPCDEEGSYSIAPVILPGAFNYAAGACIRPVTAGLRYAYVLGGNEQNLRNGGEVLTAAVGEFVAQGSSITFTQRGGAVGVLSAYLYCYTVTLTPTWIESLLRTRAYTTEQAGMFKRWDCGELQLRTWFPEFSVSLLTEGVEEASAALTDATRSNREYYAPAFSPDWNPTNINNDHATPWRKDYSVTLQENEITNGLVEPYVLYYVEDLDDPTASISYNGNTYLSGQTFTGSPDAIFWAVLTGSPKVWGPDSYVLPGENGIDFDRLQETTEELNFRNSGVRGNSVQIELRVTAGRVNLTGANVEARPLGQPTGTLA